MLLVVFGIRHVCLVEANLSGPRWTCDRNQVATAEREGVRQRVRDEYDAFSCSTVNAVRLQNQQRATWTVWI